VFDATDVITIWNRYRDSETRREIWYRYVLPTLCKYKTKIVRAVNNAGAAKQTAQITNSQMVQIPFSSDIESMYNEPRCWQIQSDTERRVTFTLQPGDLVALGEHSIEISGETPHRLADVRAELGEHCFEIKSVQDNTRSRFGRHFKIEGV